ncbi:unnamed protein product, partial [Polarella glacialis]
MSLELDGSSDKENSPELVRALRAKDETSQGLQRLLESERKLWRQERAEASAERSTLQERAQHVEAELQTRLLTLETSFEQRSEEQRTKCVSRAEQLEAARNREASLLERNEEFAADLRRLLNRADADAAENMALQAKVDAFSAELWEVTAQSTLKTGDEAQSNTSIDSEQAHIRPEADLFYGTESLPYPSIEIHNTAMPILLLCLSLAAAEHVTLKPRVGGASKGLRAAGGFLSGPDLQDDLRQAVVETLGGGNRTLDATREKLRPMWSALAKNQQGRIDRRSLRYALHRYFLHAHSLSLVGLEPLQANSSHSEAALLTAFAPDYVRGLVEGRNAGHGFSFEDTVALVAVLEHLVVETGHGMLEAAYQAKGLKAAAGMSRQQLVEVMQAFMARFMLGNEGADVVADVDRNPKMLQEVFDDWKVLSSFAEGQIRTFEYSRWSGYSAGTVRNGRSSKVHWQVRLDRGALSHSFEFADAQAVAGSIAMSFGSFWTTECSRIKGLLMDMDRGATGRVKLADFHHAALNGEWRFGESADYLRQLGALDESSALLGPRVIIPNYLQSASNCIVTQEHYRVCCKNECEDYLSEIEAAVGAPTATPELVLAVVGNITTSLDDECAKIPASLMTQLFDIANSHDGSISLHG